MAKYVSRTTIMSNPVHYHYDKFPPRQLDWEKLIPLIGPASAELARFDGALSSLPNAALLMSPLTTQEAVLSSRIEGTQATMGEVLEFEAEENTADFSSEKKADIYEVINYRMALMHAVDMLESLPLCQRVVRESHKILMQGVRGKNKTPGQYRRISNWIGPHGSTIDTARFVPISADKLNDAMSSWEKYIHEEAADKLIQLAIVHAEFESIHPFLDGNGRIGRMCVPLFMYKKGFINSPMFYISAYFEANRDEYYDRLFAVSRDNDWTGWCNFFLKAVYEQAKSNHEKTLAILSMYNLKKIEITDITHSQYAIYALDFIFSKPMFKASDFYRHDSIPNSTARHTLRQLRDSNLLKLHRKSSGRRSAVYVFPDLLNLIEGYSAF